MVSGQESEDDEAARERKTSMWLYCDAKAI
jgi:hypothetical protein